MVRFQVRNRRTLRMYERANRSMQWFTQSLITGVRDLCVTRLASWLRAGFTAVLERALAQQRVDMFRQLPFSVQIHEIFL